MLCSFFCRLVFAMGIFVVLGFFVFLPRPSYLDQDVLRLIVHSFCVLGLKACTTLSAWCYGCFDSAVRKHKHSRVSWRSHGKWSLEWRGGGHCLNCILRVSV